MAENIMAIDIGPEDTEPLEELEVPTPSAAFEALEEAEAATTKANRAVEAARKAKKRAEAVVLATLEHYELDSGRSKKSKMLYYIEPFRTFNIASEAQFKAWAAKQDENYYETKVVLREQIFQDEMKRLDDDKQALPPGVVKVQFPKLHHRAQQKRSK